MKTKPYIIDDVIYNVPDRVAKDISEQYNYMYREMRDQRVVLKEMQQELKDKEQSFNKLLEDYKELKKENSYLVQVINRLEGGCDD